MPYNVEAKLLRKIQNLTKHFLEGDKVPICFSVPLLGIGPHIFQLDLQSGKWAFPLIGLSGQGVTKLCAQIFGIPESEAARKLSVLIGDGEVK